MGFDFSKEALETTSELFRIESTCPACGKVAVFSRAGSPRAKRSFFIECRRCDEKFEVQDGENPVYKLARMRAGQ